MRKSRFSVVGTMLALMLAASGCVDSSNPVTSDHTMEKPSSTGRQNGIAPSGIQDPQELVLAYGAAMSRLDFPQVIALVGWNFRFFPREDEVGDLTCLDGDFSWSRRIEAKLLRHLTDPDYIGDAAPVVSLDMDLSIVSASPASVGDYEVLADADIVALVSESEGWTATTRFRFVLAPRRNGTLVIRELHELEIPDLAGRVEPGTWGRIKCEYF